MSWPKYSTYTDVGVSWLDSYPAGWTATPLKLLATMQNGESITSETIDDFGQYPVYGGNGLRGFADSYTHEGERVLIGRQGALCGNIHLVAGKYWASEHAIVTTPERGVSPRWLASALKVMNLGQYSQAAAQPGIAAEVIGKLRVPTPSLIEQEYIADFLDHETAKIDAVIGKQEQLIATLREDRTATITHAVTQGLDPNVVTKDSLVESLGEIPQHWVATPLKHALRGEPGAIKAGPFGSDLIASEMGGDFAKVYNQRAVLDRDPLAGPEWISEAKYREMGAFEVAPGDVLVTTRGSIGRAFEVPDDAPIGVIHPCVIRVRADQARLLNEYLLILLNETPSLREQFSLLSNATTIDVIYSRTLASCTVPIPPLAEQQQIVDYVREHRNKIDSLIAKAIQMIDTLGEYRSALIANAVTGKIDVREVA